MEAQKPVLVLPFNDPSGVVWSAFQPIIPALRQAFGLVSVGVPADALAVQVDLEAVMRADPFFDVLETPAGQGPGEYFHTLYQHTAQRTFSEQILHLAFPDRIAFALGGGYREMFLEDIRQVQTMDTPLIFARSLRAWETHPQNYRRAEDMITDTGEFQLGKRLDFAWCHLAVQAGRLAEILPGCRRDDMSFLAELVTYLIEDVKMIEVDWLAWEDPFILGRDAEILKAEREKSLAESLRRMGYVLPMIEILLQSSTEPSGAG